MVASDTVESLRVIRALARFYGRLVPYGWYRRLPFLPLPPRPYLAWRLQTAYGQTRPGWRVIAHDVWQFGRWLAQGDEPD
jgi:hypothetical protein